MENKHIEPVGIYTTRLVKSEDLNHHGTLFAGRTAEWFVESGFISAAALLDPKSVVCLKIHGMYFSKPVQPGQILKFTSKVVYAGKSSLVAYVEVVQEKTKDAYVSGFITFIHVDENTKSAPHHIEIVPKTEGDQLLYEKAKNLKAR
jgi:acyl-CoA hydrolase